MIRFELSGHDEKGMPTHVNTDDGFMLASRRFDPEQDGWMLDQLDPDDFAIILAGRQMESLVAEVNELRRENFRLKKSDEMVMSAFSRRGV